MIPKFDDFLYPFLFYAKEGNYSYGTMKQRLIKHFNLTQEDCKLLTSGGTKLVLDDRVGWALQYLRRSLLILPKAENDNGLYKVSERGLSYLENHKKLTRNDLMQYKEFVSYNSRCKNGISRATSDIQIEETPFELLEKSVATINSTLANDLLDSVVRQSPRFFENLVGKLLKAMGYGGFDSDCVCITPFSKDGGIDGIIKEDKLGLDRIYIQAKRWNNEHVVSQPDIQQFVGALDGQKATKGVYITTSKFSKNAIQYIEKSSKQIVLIDGEQLTKYMIDYNVGVSTENTYLIKKIDKDFFDEENN